MYGKELILDVHKCNTNTFTRNSIKEYCKQLCLLIDMERCDFHFWDDLDTAEEEKQTDPKTMGISAIQFIITSNITIHTLDLLGKAFINIFSCKDFDSDLSADFTENWFAGAIKNKKEIIRE